jgi:hypothetical protein
MYTPTHDQNVGASNIVELRESEEKTEGANPCWRTTQAMWVKNSRWSLEFKWRNLRESPPMPPSVSCIVISHGDRGERKRLHGRGDQWGRGRQRQSRKQRVPVPTGEKKNSGLLVNQSVHNWEDAIMGCTLVIKRDLCGLN